MSIFDDKEPKFVAAARERAYAEFDQAHGEKTAVLSETYERAHEDYKFEKRKTQKLRDKIERTDPTRRAVGEDETGQKLSLKDWERPDLSHLILFAGAGIGTLSASFYAAYSAWQASGFEIIESTAGLGFMLAMVIPSLALFAEYVQTAIDTDSGRKKIKMVLIAATTLVAASYIVALQPMLADVVNNGVSADDIDQLFGDSDDGGSGDPLVFLLQIALESLLGSVFMTACWELFDKYARGFETPNPIYLKLVALELKQRKVRDRATEASNDALLALNNHLASREAFVQAVISKAQELNDLQTRLDNLKNKDLYQ